MVWLVLPVRDPLQSLQLSQRDLAPDQWVGIQCLQTSVACRELQHLEFLQDREGLTQQWGREAIS